MKTRKGTTRRVFIFKHVVIKVALIGWVAIFEISRSLILREFRFFKKNKWRYFSEKKKYREYYQKELLKNILEEKEKFGMKIVPQKRHEIDYNYPLYYLMMGILPNIQERRFYRQTRNQFVMSTYFSLFGLVNIQKRGEQINFWNGEDIFRYLCYNSQNRNQPHIDGHTLCEIENFVLDDDGHIKLVDYGNKQVGSFLELNGENLYNNFKLPG